MMRVKGEQNVAAVRGLGSNSTQRYIEVHKRQLLEEIVAWKKKMYAVLKSAATKCCDSQFVRVVKTHTHRSETVENATHPLICAFLRSKNITDPFLTLC